MQPWKIYCDKRTGEKQYDSVILEYCRQPRAVIGTMQEIADHFGIKKRQFNQVLIRNNTNLTTLQEEGSGKRERPVLDPRGCPPAPDPKKAINKIRKNYPESLPKSKQKKQPEQKKEVPVAREKDGTIFEPDEQFQDIIRHIQWSENQGVKLSSRDVLTFLDKTNQLHNEEKEFAEDQAFLDEVMDQWNTVSHDLIKIFQEPALPEQMKRDLEKNYKKAEEIRNEN